MGHDFLNSRPPNKHFNYSAQSHEGDDSDILSAEEALLTTVCEAQSCNLNKP